MTLHFTSHYEVTTLGDKTICSMDDIKYYFDDDTIMTLNFLFLSTSGVHGGYTTLDEIEENWDHRNCEIEDCPDWEKHTGNQVTFCIVQPRTCVIRYGNVEIKSLDDIKYLRKYVEKTISGVIESQKGNRQ